MIKRVLHYLIQAVANRHLIQVSTAPISEPLDVHNDYRPVYGQASTLHAFSPESTKTVFLPSVRSSR